MTESPHNANNPQPENGQPFNQHPAAQADAAAQPNTGSQTVGASPGASQPMPPAGDPYSSPYGSPGAGGTHYGTQQPYATGGFPVQTGQAQPRKGNFFTALFDLKFNSYVSVTWAGIVYVLHILACALLWVMIIVFGIMTGFAMGYQFWGESTFNPTPLILAIIFGWIPALLNLIYGRMALEFIVAAIKTAENTKQIAEQTVPGPR